MNETFGPGWVRLAKAAAVLAVIYFLLSIAVAALWLLPLDHGSAGGGLDYSVDCTTPVPGCPTIPEVPPSLPSLPR